MSTAWIERHSTAITSVGGAIATAGMFVFHLASEPWGWVLAGVGMAVFATPFVILWREMWRSMNGRPGR